MARPKAGEEKQAAAQIGVRISKELRGKLDALAQLHGHSITDEVRAALEEYARKRSAKAPKQ